MSSSPATTPEPSSGWVLRSPADFDVAGTLETFGQVFRVPVERSERAERLDAGQPCYLISTNRSRVIGLWAVGEVVAPLATVGGEPFADVELVGLEKPIALGKLRSNAELAGATWLADDAAALEPLTKKHRKVLEALDFALVEPTSEQWDRVDAALAAAPADDEAADADEDEPLLRLVGVDRTLVILEQDHFVLAEVTEEEAREHGRYVSFADALDGVAHKAEELAIDLPDGGEDPLVWLTTADGNLYIYLDGNFELHDPAEGGLLATFVTLGEALRALGEVVEEDGPEDPDAEDPAAEDPAASEAPAGG